MVSIAAFVEHYNHRRDHESLGKLTPADVYCGHAPKIRLQRERTRNRWPISGSRALDR